MARRIAVLFPGQASQYIGMGRLAAERFPPAREVFDRVDAALGQSISGICFEGPAERLQETIWQQPAVFTCSMALYAAWQSSLSADDTLVCAAGHSLGEYGALVAAGALTLEDGAILVAARGAAMQEAADRAQGGMYVLLGLDRETVQAICDEVSDPAQGPQGVVVLANDNAPGQQVISGGLQALEAAAAHARARGARRVLPLKVAGAFHSPLMAPAVERLDAALDRLGSARVHPCSIPVVANSTAGWLLNEAAVRDELLRQVTAPVRWAESIEEMATLDPDVWVDTGPGTVVAGLAARIVPDIQTVALSTLIDTATS